MRSRKLWGRKCNLLSGYVLLSQLAKSSQLPSLHHEGCWDPHHHSVITYLHISGLLFQRDFMCMFKTSKMPRIIRGQTIPLTRIYLYLRRYRTAQPGAGTDQVGSKRCAIMNITSHRWLTEKRLSQMSYNCGFTNTISVYSIELI